MELHADKWTFQMNWIRAIDGAEMNHIHWIGKWFICLILKKKAFQFKNKNRIRRSAKNQLIELTTCIVYNNFKFWWDAWYKRWEISCDAYSYVLLTFSPVFTICFLIQLVDFKSNTFDELPITRQKNKSRLYFKFDFVSFIVSKILYIIYKICA